MPPRADPAKTTSELIADALRRAIVTGRLRAGQALRQDVLAAEFEVSKIPVREALYQLKSEGLVAFANNRGSVVSALSTDEVEEIYTMRIALERIALERALPALRPADLIRAEGALRLIDASEDPAEWPPLNWRFHRELYGAARTPQLLHTVETLHNNVARYVVLYLAGLDHQRESQEEHWALLEACRDGSGARALEILEEHLRNASRETRRFLARADRRS